MMIKRLALTLALLLGSAVAAVWAAGSSSPYFSSMSADSVVVFGTTTTGPLFEGTAAQGDFGYTWNGEFRRDQNASTYLGVTNGVSGSAAAASLLEVGGTTNSSFSMILSDNSGAPTEQFTFGSAVSVWTTNIPTFAPAVANAGNLGSVSLPWGTVYAAKSVLTPTSSTDTATLTVNGASDSNGANIKLIGDGGTTPNKYISTHGGLFEVLNSAYGSAILTLDDAGDLTLPIAATETTGTENVLSSLQIDGQMVSSASNPVFSSGACGGSMGTSLNTAAFTILTGSGACSSVVNIGMPTATHGWICYAVDEQSGAGTRIAQSSDNVNTVTFTNYSIGTTPAVTNFVVSRVVLVMCSAY